MVNIRDLTTADMFTVVAMLKKIAHTKLSTVFVSDETAAKGKTDDEKAMSMGIMILSELYDNLIDDLQKWFSSLVNKSLPEYMQMPLETTLDIIEQLSENETSKSFFSRALQVFSKMSALGNRIKNK